jgi:glycosyltransferase involved in cell wall biosynthesis
MKVVLVTLSGKPADAVEQLRARFPSAEIIELSRAAIDTGTTVQRLRQLRQERPDVFAVMTESLDWQFGQDALMLFGAMAGARESVILDSQRRLRSAGRAELLLSYPFKIANTRLKGRSALRKAHTVIQGLESIVEREGPIGKQPSKSSDTLSIAYFRATPAAGTQPGGATSHINGVVNGLLDLGAQIYFVSNDDIAGLDKTRVEFQKAPPDPDVMPRSAFDVHNGMTFSSVAAKAVEAVRPDFIYQRYCRFSWAGIEAGLKANVPLFLEYNGSEVWIGKNWDRTGQLDLLERCERLNLAAATRIFVISDVERRNLIKLGVAEGKIIVNPNGVDTNLFKPGIGGDDERAKLSIAAETILVGFVGTFGPWHGVLALADAIAMTPRDAGLHFLLIGDGSLRGEVEERLRASGDLDRVTFAGVVSHERVPVLLDACDILVSPHVPLADGSEFFGSPTKLFEYMAMGKGIVASRLGQIGEVLNDTNAMLVEPGDADELSKAITTLAADAKLRTNLGNAARETAVARHTWVQNAANIIEAYKQLG